MTWEGIEAAAFVYYCSRGMTLELVADFMYRKFPFTPGPRPKEMLYRIRNMSPPFNKETDTWDFPKADSMIRLGIAKSNITWEQFLAKMEFDATDIAKLRVSVKAISVTCSRFNQSTQEEGLLHRIEETKRLQDPLVKQALLNSTPEGAFYPGTTADMAAMLSEVNFPLSAPTSITSSDFGMGYSRITGGASGAYDDRSSPYSTTVIQPRRSASESTYHPSAGSKYLFPEPALQGSGPSPYRPSGYMAPSIVRNPSTTGSIGQAASNLQPQAPRMSQGPTQRPASNTLTRQAAYNDSASLEDVPFPQQSHKRRPAQRDTSLPGSQSRSSPERSSKKTKGPPVYEGWALETLNRVADEAATGDTWETIETKFVRSAYRYYLEYMLPDPENWGWVETARLENIKLRGKKRRRGDKHARD